MEKDESKNITIRMDADTHFSIQKKARSCGLSINAYLIALAQNQEEKTDSQMQSIWDAIEGVKESVVIVGKEARYARIHTEEVIQSLALRANPGRVAEWQKSLEKALSKVA